VEQVPITFERKTSMKHAFLLSQIHLLFFILIGSASCTNQVEANSTLDISNVNDSLRVDSILQFSVMITAILEDSKGNLWFGSHGDGLCRYDGKEYTYFTADNGLPSGYMREFAPGPDWDDRRNIDGGNQIGAIQEDEYGNIWVVTIDHISRYNGKTFTAMQVDREETLSTTRTAEEWKKELGYLWLGASDRLGLYRYDGEELVFFAFPLPYKSTRDGVSEVYKDKNGNMWIGTMENGTFRYNGKSFTRINYEDEIGICRSVFQDNTGRTWITNNRYGLLYLEEDSLVNFINEYSLLNNDEAIVEDFGANFQSIEQDANGELWFGKFGDGLWRYDGKKLTHYSTDNSLPIITAKTIYKDKRGKLWFGLGEGSVYGFDGESFYRFDGMEMP
jgi:ligand-binding sensor domain-containing protein